jgi:hypothetical protein
LRLETVAAVQCEQELPVAQMVEEPILRGRGIRTGLVEPQHAGEQQGQVRTRADFVQFEKTATVLELLGCFSENALRKAALAHSHCTGDRDDTDIGSEEEPAEVAQFRLTVDECE